MRISIVEKIATRLMRALGRQRAFSGSTSYWENRYAEKGNSGVGSYHKFAQFKAEVLNEFVATHGIRSMIELGCGDGNQLALAKYPAYIGFDVSDTIVEHCRASFKADTSKSFFLLNEFRDQRADLALSLDVIFHLVEDHIFEKHLRALFEASDHYAIIYSSNFEENTNRDGLHVRHRNFTSWIEENILDWKLINHLPNQYPYQGDYRKGSFAEFFFYEKIERTLPGNSVKP